MTNLANGITATNYAGDIVFTASNMTANAYQGILFSLEPEDRLNVIGWIRTGRSQPNFKKRR